MTRDAPTRDLIEVPLSRTKTALLLAGSLAFVASGIAFVVLAESTDLPPALLRVVGVVAIAFFGFCGAYALRKLADDAPGLVISAEGIHDNTSGISAGTILWADITGLRERVVTGQRFLVVDVIDPAKYTARGNRIQRALKGLNLRSYGSPILISANTLKIGHDELMAVATEAHARNT
jgi:hypothetical protein